MIRILIGLFTIITACWVAYSASCIAISRTILRYRPEIDNLKSAQQLTPRDPLLQAYLAQYYLYSADNNNPGTAYELSRQSTELNPKDFRVWLLRGKIAEQLTKYPEAADCFNQAVALAPNYFQTNWELANFRLRNDELPQAAAAFQRALAISPNQIPETLELVWLLTDGDLASLKMVLPVNDYAQLALVNFLLNKGQLAQAVMQWQSKPISDDPDQKQFGNELLKRLIDAKQFKLAAQVWQRLPQNSAASTQNDQLQQIDFSAWQAGNELSFGWTYRDYPEVKLTREAEGTLKIEYRAVDRPDFDHIHKIVLVNPGGKYRLHYQLRTAELNTASPPIFEIVDLTTGINLISLPMPKGTTNQQQLEAPFQVGQNTEAVLLTIKRRASCPAAEPCPIFGALWINNIGLINDAQGSKLEANKK